VLLAAVSVFLHIEKSRRGKEVRLAQERYAALVQARPMDEVKAERVQYYSIRFYLEYPAAASYAASDFIRRLGNVFQPKQLYDVQIEPGVQNFDFQLSVRIAAGAPGSALRKFAVLYDKLQEFPDVIQLSFFKEGPMYVFGIGDVQLFSIAGRAELP
jgi:hypothetical protein